MIAGAGESERALRLYRRWVGARARANARSFGVGAVSHDVRLILLVTPFALAGPLAGPDNPVVSWVRMLSPAAVVAGVAILWCVNGLLATRWLARHRTSPLTAWQRLAALLLGGFPCLGILLLSFWTDREPKSPGGRAPRELGTTPAAWSTRRGGAIPLRLRLAVDRRLHSFERSIGWPVWFWGVGFLALLALSTWLVPPPEGGGRALAAMAIEQVLRGAAIVATAGWALRRAPRLPPARRLVAVLAPFACLLPMQWAALPLLSMIAIGIDKERESGLIFAAWRDDPVRASRSPLWLRLGRSLDGARREARWWRRWRVPTGRAAGRVEATLGVRRRRRLASARVALSYLELAAAGLATAALGRSVPTLAAAISLAFAAGLALAALIGGVGWATAALRARAGAAGCSVRRWPFGTLTAAATLGIAGLLAGQPGGASLVSTTGVVILVSAAVSFVGNPFVHRGGEWNPLFWIAFYLTAVVVALVLIEVAAVAAMLSPWLAAAAVVAPLGGVGVGGRMAAWPASSPSSGGSRGGVLLEPFSLLLMSPLGGLAAAWWLDRSARQGGPAEEVP